MNRTTIGLKALIVTLSCSAPLQGGGAETDRSQELEVDRSGEIIWFDESPNRALFLPERVLATTPAEELPIGQYDLGRLQFAMEYPSDREKHSFPNECVYEERAGGPISPKSRKTLEEWVAERSLVFAGTVVGNVSGWSVLDEHPATLVYVRVDEVWRDVAGSLRVGEIVAYTEDEATVDLYGVSACSRMAKGAYTTSAGEEILFTGMHFLDDPFFLQDWLVFPVREGKVHPLHSALIETAQPQSVSKVRAAVPPGGER